MIYKDRRITLAMTFVHKSDTMPKILRRLFKRLDVLGMRIKKVYLDKGFYSIGVIRFLKERDLPFIIPARSRKKGGVSQLFTGRASYATSYTLRNQQLGSETVCSDPLELDNYGSSRRISPRKGKHYVKASNVHTRIEGPDSLPDTFLNG